MGSTVHVVVVVGTAFMFLWVRHPTRLKSSHNIIIRSLMRRLANLCPGRSGVSEADGDRTNSAPTRSHLLVTSFSNRTDGRAVSLVACSPRPQYQKRGVDLVLHY